MANFTISADGNYPSDAGIQLDGVNSLGFYQMSRFRAAYGITDTPGTGASYKLQVLARDDDYPNGNWVDVANSTLSGDGAAANGQITVDVIGEAVRLAAANGTAPGTVQGFLNVFPLEQADNDVM